jgi:hypothetical protein
MYDEYREVARKLGLRLAPEDPGLLTFSFVLEGDVEGHFVQLLRTCGNGASIRTTSPLRPAMDLGLSVRRAGLLSSIAELFGAHDIVLDDPDFDDAHAVRGDEPERVRALLQPALRARLLSLQISDIELTDAQFSSTLSVSAENVVNIELALREAALVARTVEGALARVPPAAVLRGHHDAWMAFAREHDLQASATPLSMVGRLGRTFLGARVIRKAAADMNLEIMVRSEQPLERASFDTNAERGLVELARFGAVEVDAHGIILQARSDEIAPMNMSTVIEIMRTIVETRFTRERAYR